MLCAAHFRRLQNNWAPWGNGMIGGFNVNISSLCHTKIWTSSELSPRWWEWKCVPGYAWLSREQSGLESRGICFVWSFLPFCLPARGWIHGVFYICATLQVLHLHHSHELKTKWRALISCDCPRSRHYEVAEEPQTGHRAVGGYLYLCLSYDLSHWHPAGR